MAQAISGIALALVVKSSRFSDAVLYAEVSVQTVDWQPVAVTACICAAVIYLIRHFTRSRRSIADSTCGSSGCTGCPANSANGPADLSSRLTEATFVSSDSLQRSSTRSKDAD